MKGEIIAAQAVVGGKRGNYYRITPEGGRALALTRERLGELVGELLEDKPGRARRYPA